MSFGDQIKKFFGMQTSTATPTSTTVTTTTVTTADNAFSNMKMAELREIAKSRELKGWTKLRKSELVEFLNEA